MNPERGLSPEGHWGYAAIAGCVTAGRHELLANPVAASHALTSKVPASAAEGIANVAAATAKAVAAQDRRMDAGLLMDRTPLRRRTAPMLVARTPRSQTD